MDLLKFVLICMYFQYNGSIYKQTEGTVIGVWFPLLLLSSIWRGLKNKQQHHPPRIWKHYKDNTFIILACESIESFLQILNWQPSIFFTMEKENSNRATFLHNAVKREPDGWLPTGINRKITYLLLLSP